MARRCTACGHTTDYPFQNRCPRCDGHLAIVCRAGSRPAAARRPAGPPPWVDHLPLVKASGLAAVVLIPLALWLVTRPGWRDAPAAESRGGRVSIGMPVRDAVLALEPDPPAGNRASLHDLLGPDAPAAGHFTWADGARSLSVTFRRGKVVAVDDTTMPYRGLRQVSIHADDAPEDEP